MAEYIVDGQYLASIADAIREKTGESGTMTLTEMPEKIASISGGGGSGYATDMCLVAHKTITITSQLTSSMAVGEEFVNSIHNDFQNLNGKPGTYFYLICAHNPESITNGFMASCEQFRINSTTPTSISITYQSSYHKWFSKVNGTVTPYETNNSGSCLGASAATGNTITPNAGWWAASGANVYAGTYSVELYRAYGGMTDQYIDKLQAELEGLANDKY